jgi:hypothetical protein
MGLPPRLVLSVATEEQAVEIQRKHAGTTSKFLYPRGEDFFIRRAEEKELSAVREGSQWVAFCYLYVDLKDEALYEFGGLYVDEHLRRSGLADRLGFLALSYYYVGSFDPTHRVQALVHNDNTAPLKCLGRLGFEVDGIETFEDDEVPSSLPRDADRKVRAKRFLHRRCALQVLADGLEGIDHDLADGRRFGVEVDEFSAMHRNMVAAIRDLAERIRAKPAPP